MKKKHYYCEDRLLSRHPPNGRRSVPFLHRSQTPWDPDPHSYHIDNSGGDVMESWRIEGV